MVCPEQKTLVLPAACLQTTFWNLSLTIYLEMERSVLTSKSLFDICFKLFIFPPHRIHSVQMDLFQVR